MTPATVVKPWSRGEVPQAVKSTSLLQRENTTETTTTPMGVLVRGLLVEVEEGDGGNNNFGALAPLGLQLCFDLLVVGDNQLNFGLAMASYAVCLWV